MGAGTRWRSRLAAALLGPLRAVEGPQTYAALRIGLGALVIANVSTLWPHLELTHGEFGLSPAASACVDGVARWSVLCHLPPWGPQALVVAFTAAALAFMVGLWTRVSGGLTVILLASLWWRSGVSAAGEHVFADLLLLLCLARCGEAYSVDRWLRRRRGGEVGYARVPSWPRYLMILQLALCLGVNGWVKSGATWSGGQAVFYVLAHDRFHRFPVWGVLDAIGPAWAQALTWAAWLTERGFPLVVLGLVVRPWLRRAGAPAAMMSLADWTAGRRVWATLAALLMLGISTLMNIGWFAPATAVAVLCLFRGEEVGRWLARARRFAGHGGEEPVLVEARPRPRWRLVAAAVFVLWHGWVITTRALVPLVGETVAAPIAAVMGSYERMTNTLQMWRMFSPNVPQEGWYLRALAITGDGRQLDAPSDVDLLDHGRGIKFPYDRRLKLHGTLVEPKRDGLRRAYGRWLCATWSGPAGERPVEVVLLRVVEPLPPFRWPLGDDPHAAMAAGAREEELTRVSCEGQ